MTLNDFLSALAQSLNDTPDVPSGALSSHPSPIPHVIYDPTCREAGALDRPGPVAAGRTPGRTPRGLSQQQGHR
jgi:hypothetical protein